MSEPILPESFDWADETWGRVLRCRPLAAVAQHVFTTRQLPLSGSAAGDGWQALASVFGVDPGHLVQLTQVHGVHVVTVPDDTTGPRPTGTWADGDAVMTDAIGLALAVKVADCVPILIADRSRPVVAAVHAGWRGTAAGIVTATVQALCRRYRSSAGDLIVAIGPSIGPCCYQVGTDVCDRFLEAGNGPDTIAEWFTVGPKPSRAPELGLGTAARAGSTAAQPGKLWLDTWQANIDLLVSAGVPRAQIYCAGLCTACDPDLWHSYRVAGGEAGRMVGAIKSLRAGDGGWRHRSSVE
jgi:YfiH family protein